MDINWQSVTIKVLSLLLAVILWVYVSNEQKNPQAERELDVNLEVAGLAPDYMITGGLPENVRIIVQGYNNRLTAMSASDFRAQVIVPAETTGLVTLPVLVSSPSGLHVQVQPAVVGIYIDTFMEKTVPVVVSVQGAASPGYTAESPQPRPATVKVRGNKQAVGGVEQVYAVINIESAQYRIEQSLTLSTDAAGVSISPDTVRVVVPVKQNVITKTLPVTPQIIGEPAKGYTVGEVKAEPDQLQVSGLPADLDELTELLTAAVDIQGADKSVTVETAVIDAAGVEETESRLIKVIVTIVKNKDVNLAAP